MYITKQIQTNKQHSMYAYFDKMCRLANNMYNTTLFYIKQYATAKYSFEEMKPLYEHQLDVYNTVEQITKGTKYQSDVKIKWLNYNKLDFIFKVMNQQDYRSLSVHSSQHMIKQALCDFDGYFKSIKRWKANPSGYTGKPKMPGYKKSGGLSTIFFSNQDCVIKKDGTLKFPKVASRLNISKIKDTGTLKEVRVKPYGNCFVVNIAFEHLIDGEIIPDKKHNEKLLAQYKDWTTISERALAIDTGLSNLCSVVNNFEETPFIVKGTILKSINHQYNKQLAHYQSISKKVNDLYMTNRINRLTRKRNNRIKDYMHKATKYIADYAKKNNVKIVVVGHNKLQKQKIALGNTQELRKKNNQNFVQIPILVLINQLQYKLNKYGIELVVVEESYTSQASFENMDYLPTYGIDDDKANFSGKRIHRGLYKTDGKNPINADINGAANILRKVFPNVRKWDIGVMDTPVIVRVA